MDQTFTCSMEVDGALTEVVAVYQMYRSGPQIDEVSGADGEPVDISFQEFERLRRQISQKHRRVAV